jgi:hypothetical protein
MFSSKKQTTPMMPWAVQILTTEYLIDGSVQPSEYSIAGKDMFVEANKDFEDEGGTRGIRYRTWREGKVQPTGNLTSPVQYFTKLTLGACANLVAIIPNDDACRQAAKKAFQKYQHPVSATVYAGPYHIRGTALTHTTDQIRLFGHDGGLLPFQNAEIESQLPGARLTGLKAPWLLLNGGMIHCFVLD